MAVYDFRQYTLKPGATPDYMAAVRELALPIRQKYGIKLAGWYYSEVGVRRAKRHVGMREARKRVTPWGMLGTPCVFGVQHLRPLEGVSSIPLKGAMRRKQVSKRWCLTKRRHGESI